MYLSERLPRETGRDYALRTIRENIIRLALVPGSMVSENELAAEMGLSRTPVREALIELSKTRIVEIYPQRGSSISRIDRQLVEEALFLRRVLECAVVEQCCAMPLGPQLAALEENLHLQQFYYQEGGTYTEKLMELDTQFHSRLFAMAQKPQVYHLMDNLSIHADRVRTLALSRVKDEKIVADHALLLDAIRRGDAAEARSVMLHHLDRYQIDLDGLQQKYPDYFH